jgi:hypothetical protein
MTALFEGLKVGDLKRLVRNDVFIDEYSSKMGQNQNVVTVSFKITDREPAEDLVKFIEKGYDFVLDADVSDGEKTNDDYLVFAEIPRTEEFPTQLMTILNGIENLTSINDWMIKYKGQDTKYPASTMVIKDLVPCTPEDFDARQQQNLQLEQYKNIARVPRTGSWDFYDSVRTFKGK